MNDNSSVPVARQPRSTQWSHSGQEPSPSMLLVDDDEGICRTLTLTLRKKGYETETAVTGQEALEKARSRAFNLALVDIRLPDMAGVDLVAPLREMHPHMAVIMVTGYASVETAIQALNEGASGYVTKPVNMDELLAMAREALEKQRLVEEKQRAEETLRESEAKFKTLIDQAPEALFLHDMDGRIVDVNQATVERYGYTRKQLLQMKASDIDPDYVEREDRGAFWRELKQEKQLRFEARHRRKDGSIFPVEISLSAIEIGGEKHILALADDISERKRTEEALRESEARYRITLEALNEGVYDWSIRENTSVFSPSYFTMLGYEPDEFEPSLEAYNALLHPDDRERSRENLERFVAGDEDEISAEIRMHAKDGSYRWILSKGRIVERDGEGNPLRVVGTNVDITERKQAEEGIRQERETLALVNALNHAANQGDSLYEIIELFDRLARDVFSVNSATVYLLSQDEEYLVLQNLSLPANLVRRIESLIGVDIPQVRIRLGAGSVYAEILQAGEPRITHDPAAIRQMMAECTENKALRKLVPAVSRILGYRSVMSVPLVVDSEVIGLVDMSSQEPFSESDLERLAVVAEQFTAIFRHKQTEEERAHLTNQVHEQARQMEQILATVPAGVLLLDAEGRILQANPTAEGDLAVLARVNVGEVLTGLGDRPLAELLTSPPTKGLWHEVEAGNRTFEAIARPVESGPEPEHWVLVINDVTQVREIRAQLQQQERLAAVGQLASGIAHDFNNIMAVIVLYAQMAAQPETLPQRDRERMAVIIQQARHAARLIEQILDFSRRALLERRPLDLLPLLKEQVKLLKRTLPEYIEIVLAHGPEEYTVHADPTRMQQMLTNLAVNARDAMPQGGILRIELERVTVERGMVPLLPEIGPQDAAADAAASTGASAGGEWIRLTVSDTGTGIPPDALPHVFEPFFTTKGPGEGSGLGLAQVHGIVGQHGGHIDVETQAGEGTTFTIYLPALEMRPAEPSPPDISAVPRGHGEAVLVVEDGDAVRAALVASLEQWNYQTLEAANGEQALAVMEEQGENIDLVLSDVVMPGMSGIALFHALRQKGWRTPVILLTGHPMDRELEKLRAQGLSAWLAKPPSIERLVQAVADALRK